MTFSTAPGDAPHIVAQAPVAQLLRDLIHDKIGVYFESDRLTAHRFLRVNFFVDPEITSFPDPRFRLSSVLEELAARRPAYLMFEQLHIRSPGGRAMGEIADGLPQHPEVLDLLRGYRFETQIEDFSVYRRIE